MGYSDAYGAFEQTLQHAMALSNSVAGRVADDATVDGTKLFARMGIQAYSLMLILPPISRRVECVDLCSSAAITRNLIETFLMMHYLWLDRVPPNVKQFRVLVWKYHQIMEATKGINCQRVAFGKEPYDKASKTENAKNALCANPEFLLLDDKRRAQLLANPDPRARGLQGLAIAAGISAAKFNDDYKLLSSLSHPNGFGVRAMDATTLADNEWQIWFAQIVWIAQTYLELGVSGVRMCISQADCSQPRGGADTDGE